MQIWSISGTLAAASGHTIGGLLVGASWRWIFLLNLRVGIIATIAGVRIPDLLSGLTLVGAVGALALDLVKAPDWGWSYRNAITCLVVAGSGWLPSSCGRHGPRCRSWNCACSAIGSSRRRASPRCRSTRHSPRSYWARSCGCSSDGTNRRSGAASAWPLGPSTDVDIDQWAAALQINIVAVAQLTFALLPGMLGQGWGRIVNVCSGIAVNPGGMPVGNAYATANAALEAHTVNLAAELAGTGVTVNAYRPGTVDTAMQEWIRARDPGEIGAPLHGRFVTMYRSGVLITPQASAHALVSRLGGAATGRIWDVSDPV